ncbi:hypothetical protein TPHV1_150039 [Treponema phagedenis]|uniref:Uncharacterized protein n=1 Tax=Treponema phagedenis TaxID=162 RepID=A0A0B7GUE8_TREPH|nr:hypothetical protein TPHV1_150039 [Treponema phagedenis]
MPSVFAASKYSLSTCKNDPRAVLYISGKLTTTAAITVAQYEKTIWKLSKLYIGAKTPRAPKNMSNKNPTTVGGSTNGKVNIPSNNALYFVFITKLAAKIPKKNVMNVEIIPVLTDI